MNTSTPKPPLEIVCSQYFLSWLSSAKISLVFTTYQSCRLFFLGVKPDGKLSAFERLFDRAMGLYATADRLYMSSRYQIWQMDNILQEGETRDGYDKMYVPRVTYTTGDLDIHDIVVDNDGKVCFVNTLYSCIGSLSQRYSFIPEWKPPFISKLVPEDRCHLNGLAMRDGIPRYASAVSMSDMVEGWRDKRSGGGCIMDIQSDEIIATGLSMPHSPRYYRDRLWVLNSGVGDFGYIDIENSRFEPMTFCQGYLRGLAFHNNYAIVGLSKPRHERTFSGLPLDDRLSQKHTEAMCGFLVIDLNTGDIVHWVRLEGVTTELYDVQILAGIQRPTAVGIKSDEICRIISIPPWTPMKVGSYNTLLGASSINEITDSDAAPMSFFTGKKPETERPMAVNGNNRYGFAVFENMAPEQVSRYDRFTFPNIRKRWDTQKPKGPLTVALATLDRNIVGAAVAELSPVDKRAQIVSLLVGRDHRNNRIGTNLLTVLENALCKDGSRQMELFFRSDWGSYAAIKKLIASRGWLPSKVPRILCRTTIDKISMCPWLKETQLPEGFSVFPWSELTQKDREAVIQKDKAENGWFPQVLTPFQEEDRVEYINSIGLRYQGDVVGWMHNHRTALDTIQYTSLFVDEKYRSKKIAVALVAQSIKLQIKAGIDKFIFMVDSKNQVMLNFVKQRLETWLTNLTEYHYSIKNL